MDINFITKEHENYAKQRLENYYANNFISAEKKPYLSKHSKSFGPYLAVEGNNDYAYILDAASQIATLGLGFNATAFFGISHFKECWNNNMHTENAKDLLKSYAGFLKAKTGNRKQDLVFVNSGAEANETALGMAYRKRKNRDAKHVLAFEGSFHGRFLISLFSTWNKSKREPFQTQEHQTIFIPYPDTGKENFLIYPEKEWIKLWSAPKASNFDSKVNELLKGAGRIQTSEIKSLLKLKEQLDDESIFAIIIEPMQCEGGDRYSSPRFHNALVNLAHSYGVEVIYDEVQTGFGLGRDFFWHKTFSLKNVRGEAIYPDYITCAKKAQSGIVITRSQASWKNQEVQFSSILRGFYQGLLIDQYSSRILSIEQDVEQRLKKLVSKYPKLSAPRQFGVAFAFDVDNAEDIPKFISKRFDVGLLFYQAGSNTLRFRLNTSFKDDDIDFLFEMIDSLCDYVYNDKELKQTYCISKDLPHIDWDYQWHLKIIESRINGKVNAKKFSSDFFAKNFGLELIEISADNFNNYKDQIIAIEKDAYEPERRTDIEKFELVVNSRPNVAIGLLKDNELIGICFAGLMSNFPFERGLRRAKYFHDPKSIYMLDTTTVSSYQGKGVGKFLKYTCELYACEQGLNYIYGRNRDKLAAGMLSINTSLGIIPELYIEEDYPDDEDHRNVILYRSPLKWEDQPLHLSTEIQSPCINKEVSYDFVKNNIEKMTNKICLSNFVNLSFLDNLKTFSQDLSKDLQHLYTASGQSECVDKIYKSIFYHNKTNGNKKLLSFRDHYFGKGSFLSRSLSDEYDKYFDVTHVDHPTSDNEEVILKQIEDLFSSGDFLAAFIEPIPQKIISSVTPSFLGKLRNLCDQYNISLVYNETTYAYSPYNADFVKASNIEEIRPDAAFTYVGGQFGVCYMKEEIYLEQPLMMISTWDGDEITLSQYLLHRETKSPINTEILESINKHYHNLLEYDQHHLRVKGVVPTILRDLLSDDATHYFVQDDLLKLKENINEYRL